MPDLNPDGTLSRGEILARRTQYHEASPETRVKHESVADHCTDMAKAIVESTLESREQHLTLTKLDELRMWWNAATAFDGQGFDPANR